MPSKAKKQKKSAPVTTIDTKKESPFVSYDKLRDALEALKTWRRVGRKNRKTDVDSTDEVLPKKPLFEDMDDNVVSLQMTLKKTPLNKSTYIYAISLPNHWRHESSDYETCLIVKDMDKTPLKDRDLDLTETKNHYKELLSKDNSDQLVAEVLPMRELRNEYKLFEAKERLCRAFNTFLCDRRLLHNKFDYLPLFLGKSFWITNKKVPIPVDLSSATLKADLESKLNQTQLYLSGKGDSINVAIGILKQSTEKLADNLLAVTKKVSEEFGNNIRSLSVKTDKSIAVTFFLDCGFISDVEVVRKSADNTPLEDDFSHFVNSKIQVFKNGNIRVVPKTDTEGDDKDDDISEPMEPIESKWLSITEKTDNRKKSKKKRMRLSSHKSIKRRKVVHKQSVEQKTD